MPLPFFNVNQPTSAEAIQAYIGGFANPEAAERATPYSGAEYLRNQYSVLTGNAFADPFEDARSTYDRAVTSAAANGASVAVGGNTGSRLLSPPQLPIATNGQPPPLLPTNVEGNPLSPLGTRTAQNSLMTSMLQNQGRQHQLAGMNLQLPPDPRENNYLQILDKRANLSGVGDLFGEVYRSDPEIFRAASTNDDDPRFARVQGGKEGKIEAANRLHPIAMNARFMQEARRNPTKAKALYSAVTNGRDYETDIAAQSQLFAEQRDSRKKIIESIKDVKADPVTGELFEVIDTKDQFSGKMSQQQVPLTPLKKAAIEAEGGFKRIYGIELPDRGGLPKLEGVTTAGQQEYRTRTQKLMKEQGLSSQEAANLARRQMYQEQQQTKGVATLQSPTELSGVPKAMNSLMRFGGSAINAVTQNVLNPQLSIQPDSILKAIYPTTPPNLLQIPRIDVPTTDEEAQRRNEIAIAATPSFGSLWEELTQSRKPTFNGQTVTSW